MKVRRILSAVGVLLCGIVLWGCSSGNRVNIEPFTPYYIQYLMPYSFPHTIERDDMSFLEFDGDFKNLWISFDAPGGHQRVNLIITSSERRNGQIKGTASRIHAEEGPDKGKLLRYSFWSDNDTIYFRALVTYKVWSVENDQHVVVTVERDMVVARFARVAPRYIGGAA